MQETWENKIYEERKRGAGLSDKEKRWGSVLPLFTHFIRFIYLPLWAI